MARDRLRTHSMKHYIFTSAMLDFAYNSLAITGKNSDLELMEAIVNKCGEDIRKLIQTYTGLDSHTFYRDDNEGAITWGRPPHNQQTV